MTPCSSYEPGELLGRHSNILNFDPPEKNRPLVEAMLHQVNTTGSWTGEFRNCRKNGKPFFTHAHISLLTLGQKKLYVSVQEDITERRRAREMLKRQAELLDLAHDAIMVRDLRGRISYWNRGAEELYGWKSSEAMAKVAHQLLATEFPEPLQSIETLVFETGHWEGELIHTTRDGRRVTVDSRWSLKRDDTGGPLAILEIGHDITARKASQAALKKARPAIALWWNCPRTPSWYMPGGVISTPIRPASSSSGPRLPRKSSGSASWIWSTPTPRQSSNGGSLRESAWTSGK